MKPTTGKQPYVPPVAQEQGSVVRNTLGTVGFGGEPIAGYHLSA